MTDLPTHHPAPKKGPGADQKMFTVELSEYELQCLANGIAAFYNYCSREKINMNPVQVSALHSAMMKFKHVTSNNKAVYRAEIVGIDGQRIS